MTTRKALVTGGAGFLGPHLIGELMRAGWTVAAVDNFVNGKRQHLASFAGSNAFAFFEGDITDADFVETVVARTLPDTIFHLAAHHFIPYCSSHPSETLAVNVVGTQHLLDAIAKYPVERFLFASTVDVYQVSVQRHKETDALGSNNVYGTSKLCCEQLLQLAGVRCPQTRFTAVRLSNMFGPGETNPHILPEILGQLEKANVLRLGNMDPQRDYLYVGDAARAFLLLARYEGEFGVFNVATGTGTSVHDLVAGLQRVTGLEIRVETDPAKLRASDRPFLIADISRILTETSWRPEISLEQGLRQTIGASIQARVAAVP